MARTRKPKASIPDNIAEEYYQICQEILYSFPKYRPPVDLFQFRQDIVRLFPFSRKGTRLTNEQVEQVQGLCDAGNLFVSRQDLPIYAEHIVKQVDLVLQDANLKESEAADIIIRALNMRLSAFVEQPVRPVFESLYCDLMVLTEFVWQDKHRVKLFMRRLHTGEHTLVDHSLNTLFVGLWLFVYTYTGTEFRRRHLDRAALGLLLHDVGMGRVPLFIRDKSAPLSGDEKDKLLLHPLAGIKVLQKLNLGFDEMNQAVLEHHERLDGSGYPLRTKNQQISRFGKLCAVADSFAAMICKRVYAPAKEPLAASQELVKDGARYDARFTTPIQNAYLTGKFELPNLEDETLPPNEGTSPEGATTD
ncbi:MAG: HD domain-containing phosphohydrolase [Bilophila sp.]